MPGRRTIPDSEPCAWQHWGWPALGLGCALLCVYLFWCAFSTSNITGMFDDDAVYQVTAKSLATGHGYVRIDRPGEPHQTKYPPLYPLLLAALWNLGGGFPGNGAWLRLPAAISTGWLVWWGVRYAARGLGLGPAGLIALAVAILTLPEWRLFTLCTMSELPFAALAFAALWFSERSAAADGREALGWALLAGTLAGLALLTRTVGVSLAAALVVWFCWRRKWSLAGACAGPAVICAGGWKIWCAACAAGDAATRNSPLLRYDLDYSAWLPHSATDLGRVVWQNLEQYVFTQFQLVLRLPGRWFASWLMTGENAGWWHGLAWLVMLLLIAGWIRSARRRLSAGHLFIVLYALLGLIWPFGPNRFVLPILPLVIAFVVNGLGWLPSLIPAMPGRRWGAWLHCVPAAAYAVAAVWLNLAGYQILIQVSGEKAQMGGNLLDVGAVRRTAEWLREHTPTEAVVAARRSSMLYLWSGRRTTILTPYNNPVAYHYSPQRDWRRFYLFPTADEPEAVARDSAGLMGLYDQLGVGYIVRTRDEQRERLFAEALAAFERQNQTQLRFEWGDKGLGVAINRIVR